MLLLPLLLLLTARAGDEIQVAVSIDDRSAGILVHPELRSDQEGVSPAPFTDDGTFKSDVAADRIWMANLSLRKAEAVVLKVTDGKILLGAFPVSLPASESVAFSFRTRTEPPVLLLDTGAAIPRVIDVEAAAAPTVSTTPVSAQSVEAPVVVNAVATGTEDPSVAADSTRVTLTLDDRKAERLTSPTLTLTDETPVPLSDDGTVTGDTAGDRIWSGTFDVRRAQYIVAQVGNGEESLGSVTIFLPSASVAKVAIRSLRGSPALTADVAAGVNAAAEATQVTHSSGFDAFSATLWVFLLFGVGVLAWVRGVVRRVWVGELQPFKARVEAFMERHDREAPR